MKDIHIKCVVIGDGSVGKTSLLISYVNNSFPEEYVPTVFDNFTTNVIYENKIVELDLWDTAGQEEYDKLRPLSYHDTNVFILCYSVACKYSFQNISEKWSPEIKTFCPNKPFILVANKLDLRGEPDENDSEKLTSDDTFISFRQGYLKSIEIGALDFVECSSKTREGLKDVFYAVLSTQFNIEGKKKKKKCFIM